ncbi:MAG: phosphatidylserine decarboxylase family protein [Ignavibacteriales bacterium CG_4_9_14_3_um_filter_34_10]|nr:MAG: phosphatidylserine decarboxylase family protein [Ignavibacteriales bacterium CG_4_9_14_3_um_filter_34_10]
MITKYGFTTIGIVFVLALILIFIAVITNNQQIKIGLIVLSIFILVFTLNFFRDPERSAPINDNYVYSPADGKVMLIKKVLPNRFLNEECWQISVFMSPLNVHVNRIPVSGKVTYLNYVKGKYLMAFNDKADLENERNEIGIESKNGKVFFTQVAGFIARRIVSELKLNQDVKQSERFGMIKFGSRVDVIVPTKWKVKVKKDENVKAGETILFECENEN